MVLFPEIGLREGKRKLDGPPSIGLWVVGHRFVSGVRYVETPEQVAEQRQMTIAELDALNPGARAAWREGLELRVYYWPAVTP